MIDFVERKHVDYARIQEILASSDVANHWSNYGPVSALLEEKIANCLGLGKDRSVIVTANGTLALFALVEMHNFMAGKPLKWVVCSFGFYCSHQGPLADAEIIDCTLKGVLDLNCLPKQFDAIVVTNPFGVLDDLTPYVDYCRDHSKVLICDSASAFNSLTSHSVDEIISFHHTKPWGFGEGGCVVVDRKNEDMIRALVNFGKGFPGTGRMATNGKISDVSCAYILERLESLGKFSQEGIEQYNRVVKMGKKYGFDVLIDRPIHHVPHCVPLLAKLPISNTNNLHIKVHKYYEPIIATPNATALYDRILNFPCHRDMESLPDAKLKEVFQDFSNTISFLSKT